ncbi:sensor histidine kinase [Pedobacter montanisoli]|uniref:histidine kinase n=1 Tax=Pedobacter montanisoli TaxID=2923277 RepID=A0ABS9ZXJ9_9SPHI|nr:HAMP domain-containing sensor histidine kinase [Pedobacter montanisoli]MCJ0743017.1 ATP-binding protein [Pedobacter montanisoli]
MAKLHSWLSAHYIIGDPEKHSLEERIFNTFCIIAIVAFFFEIFFNYYMGLKAVAIICFLGTIFSIGLYYLSRCRRNTKWAIRSLGIVANFTFLFNYFFNSGIYGPNLVLFCLILLITIVVVPKKELAVWITLNMVTVLGVLVFEYLYPEFIPNTYRDDLTKAIDFGITYMVVALLICLSISFIRNNYDRERNKVFLKNLEVQEQHIKILEQNKSLEKLNLEKAKLFSIVAHDIRSPLSSILGYLEILVQTDMSKEEDEQVQSSLLQVTKDTLEMLTNVLMWSKSQLDGTRVDIVEVDVADELGKGLSLERNIANKKDISLRMDINQKALIAADLNMFLIVVRNLVNNAIKFTPEGGKVWVSVEQDAENCLIKIKDNGLGIKEQNRDELFKLKALSTFGTNNEKGVGLGLLLCKEFTELQGGKIWYEANDEEGGSCFVVSFKLYAV